MSHKGLYRILTILAILAVLLTGCSKGSSNKLIGKWEGQVSMAGQSINIQVEFTKDTITITLPTGPQTIPYTYVDSKTIKGTDPLSNQEQTINYTLNGDKLSFTIMGLNIELTRVK